jgi:hypothetical protein
MNINDVTKEVGKMYIIKETQEWWDDSIVVCVMDSKEQCDEIIAEFNKEYNSARELRDECESCIEESFNKSQELYESDFELRNTCGRSNLKTDRNGIYCENDMSHNSTNMISYYYVSEISVREKV